VNRLSPEHGYFYNCGKLNGFAQRLRALTRGEKSKKGKAPFAGHRGNGAGDKFYCLPHGQKKERKEKRLLWPFAANLGGAPPSPPRAAGGAYRWPDGLFLRDGFGRDCQGTGRRRIACTFTQNIKNIRLHAHSCIGGGGTYQSAFLFAWANHDIIKFTVICDTCASMGF